MTVDLNLNYDLGYETGNLSVTFRLVQNNNRSFVSFKIDNCWLWYMELSDLFRKSGSQNTGTVYIYIGSSHMANTY